jgi:hypothetical protein
LPTARRWSTVRTAIPFINSLKNQNGKKSKKQNMSDFMIFPFEWRLP